MRTKPWERRHPCLRGFIRHLFSSKAAPPSVPDEPVNEDGRPLPYRVILADHESLDLAPGVYAEADEVAETRMAQRGESLLMLEGGKYQHEQEYAHGETPEHSASQNHCYIVSQPRQCARQREAKSQWGQTEYKPE